MLDPSGGLVLLLLKNDIGDCVHGDPSMRLATVAQLKKRLQHLDKRVANARARIRAEHARPHRLRRLRAGLGRFHRRWSLSGGCLALAFMEWRLAKRNEDRASRRGVDREDEREARKQRARRGTNRPSHTKGSEHRIRPRP